VTLPTLIALGSIEDKDFISLKDWNMPENSERMAYDGTGWGGLSNNTVALHKGESASSIVESIAVNGEPGVYHIDLARDYGRMIDGANYKDSKVAGLNPCAEATLEDCEFCNLSEIFPHHHEDIEDFKATIKHAYLYCKAVTLLPTPWPETNEVITRNRRIGTSISGIVQFTEMRSWHDLRQWADAGYRAIEGRDKQYSEWLGIRESIKTTVIKPSGTVSLLCGATPGVHWPVAAGGYIRRQRFAKIDPIVNIFKEAGYNVEDDVSNDTSVVVEFYTQGPEIRNEREVSVWEKVSLAVLLQRYWADQAVSATFTFRPDEQAQIGQIVSAYGDQLKSLSFLPLGEKMAAGAYPQMPYEAVDQDWFDQKFAEVKTLNFDQLYNGLIGDVDAEKFCTNDSCEI
jgi:adenosylcobalamin-dependent ribonucleoside-triphosphate reductase